MNHERGYGLNNDDDDIICMHLHLYVCVWFMCFSYQIIFQSELIFLILLFRSSAMRILSLCGLGFYFLVLAEVFPLYIQIMCTAWYISTTERNFLVLCFHVTGGRKSHHSWALCRMEGLWIHCMFYLSICKPLHMNKGPWLLYFSYILTLWYASY